MPVVHDAPPLVLTPATKPRAPPLDQRSCCQMPTTRAEFVGSTSTQGSTSLLANSVPDWVSALSAVQPLNGLVPDTCTSGSAVNWPATASPAPPSRVPTRIKAAGNR